MSSAERAKEAIVHIDKAMTSLDGRRFDTAWYLLSMAKLSLLEVAYPIHGTPTDRLAEFMSCADLDYAAIHPKKH